MSSSIVEETSIEHEDAVVEDCESKELVDSSSDESKSPRDDYWIVYLLFYLYGMTSMMPWNFFITANDYWMYKFRDVSPRNYSLHIGKTPFQAEFTSYMNVAASLPSTICLIANTFYGHVIPLYIRMNGSLFLITCFFLLTTALVQVDTDNWQNVFFIITMITVVMINGAGALFGGSLYGIAGKFDPQYMAAVMNGQSLGGIAAAVAQILSLAFKVSATHSAMIYFVIGDFVMLFSFLSYFYLTKIEFFTHYMHSNFRDSSRGSINNRMTIISNKHIIKKIWIYVFSLGIVLIVSTSIYPSVTVLVESHHSGTGGDWNNIFYVPVVNYLIYNCGDYTGRVVAGLTLKPKKKSWIVATIASLRIILIPLMMMCNIHPRSNLPVLIESDWGFIILMTIFAFSNGYLLNISMINAARDVDHHEKERASSLMAAALGVSIAVGSCLGMVLVKSL